MPAIVAFPTVPVAIEMTVLRYRLFEMDRIVSRTVAWALVTSALVAVFAGCVVGLQALLADVTNGETVAVAGATVVAAAAFQPIRRHLQTMVDHRFNRARYDAGRTTTAFGEQLRGSVRSWPRSTTDVATVVDVAFRPTGVGVWRSALAPVADGARDHRAGDARRARGEHPRVIRNAVIHVANEQPLLVDLYELPSPADVGMLCTNMRMLDGRRRYSSMTSRARSSSRTSTSGSSRYPPRAFHHEAADAEPGAEYRVGVDESPATTNGHDDDRTSNSTKTSRRSPRSRDPGAARRSRIRADQARWSAGALRVRERRVALPPAPLTSSSAGRRLTVGAPSGLRDRRRRPRMYDSPPPWPRTW